MIGDSQQSSMTPARAPLLQNGNGTPEGSASPGRRQRRQSGESNHTNDARDAGYDDYEDEESQGSDAEDNRAPAVELFEDGDDRGSGAISEPEYGSNREAGSMAPAAEGHLHYQNGAAGSFSSAQEAHTLPHATAAETASRHASGYSSDSTPRLPPRISTRTAQRPVLTFGGPNLSVRGAYPSTGGPAAARAAASSRRDGKPPARVGTRAKRANDRERLRVPLHPDGHDDASSSFFDPAGGSASSSSHPMPSRRHHPMADPLEWRGGSPPTQPLASSSSIGMGSINGGGGFAGLPPLLAGLENNGPGPLPTPSRTPSASKILRCSSYCCALGVDLMLLYRALSDAYGLPCRMHKDGLNAVLHCQESNGRDGDAHSFFFSYGCVVTWGLSEAQEREMLKLLTTAGCAQEPLDEHEVDDFGYTHQLQPSASGSKPGIAKDVVYLSTLDVREKLAVSFALAQSVKLGVFERTVEQTIQETRSIPERMALDGKIRLQRTSITKRIGQLFVDRASINLHSDILDHPEFFWEDDEWLPLYLRAAKYLEIDRRAEVLNKRLDIIKELFDMLASELHNSHSNKLEWIIIILIVLEVVFQVAGLIMGIAE